MTRSVLGLAAVLWLNLAVLPCAMALEGGDDCAHCPPDAGHEMAAHHDHGADHARPPCATMQSDCCDLEAVSIDTRGGKDPVKPASDVVFVSTPATAPLPSRTLTRIISASDPPELCGSSPPLHVLYCVYLD